MTKRPDEYIGDGVYLTDDGYQLWLAVGDRTNQVVALDISTFSILIERGTERFIAMNTPDPNQSEISITEANMLLSAMGMQVIVVDEDTDFDAIFGETKEKTDEETNSTTE